MLGKTAGSLFWMSRYLERSENTARMTDAGFRIALTRAASAADEWESLLTAAGAHDDFAARHGSYTTDKAIDFLLRDKDNPASVLSLTRAARENARTARTALTREVFEAVNESWIALSSLLAKPVRRRDLPERLAAIRQLSALVRGAVIGTQLRHDGYNFMRLGTFFERADNTARILDVKYYLLLPSIAQVGSSLDTVQWETILRSVSAHRSYRWVNGVDITPLGVAEYLIMNRQMPRSMAFCYAKIEDNLGHLAGEYGVESQSKAAARDLCERMFERSIEDVFDGGLHEYIQEFITANARIGIGIEQEFRFQDRFD